MFPFDKARKSDCDCSKVPFAPECIRYCIELTLRSATPEEKQLILGLDPKLTKDIFEAYRKGIISNFDDLEKQLSRDQIQFLVFKFERLTQYQVDYFNMDREEREAVIRAIQRLRLGRDNS